MLLFINLVLLFFTNSTDVIIKGEVLTQNNSPVAYASISVPFTTINVITNEEGKFLLKIPETLNTKTIVVQAMGYETAEININKVSQPVVIKLKNKAFELQEVTVRAIDATEIVKKAIENKTINYFQKPMQYQTYFRKLYTSSASQGYIVETVSDIWNSYPQDKFEIKLIKVRGKATNKAFEKEMNYARPNVFTPLWQDVNHEGDWTQFIQKKNLKRYAYTLLEVKDLGTDSVYAIQYKPAPKKNGKTRPGMEGILYIETKTFAITGYDNNWNQAYLKKDFGITYSYKSGDCLKTKINVSTQVRYQKIGNKWYLQQASRTGDKELKCGNSTEILTDLHQLSVTHIDTTVIESFDKAEKMDFLRTKVSHVKADFNDAFWGDYNVMPLPAMFQKK